MGKAGKAGPIANSLKIRGKNKEGSSNDKSTRRAGESTVKESQRLPSAAASAAIPQSSGVRRPSFSLVFTDTHDVTSEPRSLPKYQ